MVNGIYKKNNAGHYIPQLTDVLLTHNEKSKGFKFNIKGVAVSTQAYLAKCLLELDFIINNSNSCINLSRLGIHFLNLIGMSLQPMSISGLMA